MLRKVAIIYGLGGGWLDPTGGEATLLARCKAAGFIVPPAPFDYTDSQDIHDFLLDADWRAAIGDSAGATFMGEYCESLKPLRIDYVAGFQPSADMGLGATIPLPTNIAYAHVIRDSNWADTGGLGWAKWVPSAPTVFVETDHRGAHPDDTGPMQDLIFAELKMKAGV